MYHLLENRISRLDSLDEPNLFKQGKIGLEKESLRVSKEGTIAATQHSASLGAALTNPYITTDYSEALLEFITPPMESADAAIRFLQDIHKFAYTKLEDEILWSTSMPCVLTGEDSIKIAEYGSSNAGLMKTVYRRGLGYRYSKMMQVIAGIHYNYSLPEKFWVHYRDIVQSNDNDQDFISEQYFNMIRNLQRFGWLIPYLFGASPAVCKTFMDGIEKILKPFDEFTYFEPHATSLRMGDIGYQNYKEGKSGIKANYNSLNEYIQSLRHAINTPSREFAKIGVKVNGEYRQLNANLLQIENEYYSTIRPKQITGTYEKPTVALAQRGVRYVELRSLDLNVFEPLGINLDQLHFLECFMLFCLLHESPPIDGAERKEIDKNQLDTAHHGRTPGLKLQRNGEQIILQDWALEISEAMKQVAVLLDKADENNRYTIALDHQIRCIENPDLTPSARILQHMVENQQSFYPYSMKYAKQHAEYFSQLNFNDTQNDLFEDLVKSSIAQQKNIEAQDKLSFDEFLERYFSDSIEAE